jgi:predicted nucleic acid-binding protein
VALIYFDSSAFVKLLAEEPGSDLAARLWDGCDAAVASRLAYPEVRAALAASARNHDITKAEPAGWPGTPRTGSPITRRGWRTGSPTASRSGSR